jgi:hypothetical protein
MPPASFRSLRRHESFATAAGAWNQDVETAFAKRWAQRPQRISSADLEMASSFSSASTISGTDALIPAGNLPGFVEGLPIQVRPPGPACKTFKAFAAFADIQVETARRVGP